MPNYIIPSTNSRVGAELSRCSRMRKPDVYTHSWAVNSSRFLFCVSEWTHTATSWHSKSQPHTAVTHGPAHRVKVQNTHKSDAANSQRCPQLCARLQRRRHVARNPCAREAFLLSGTFTATDTRRRVEPNRRHFGKGKLQHHHNNNRAVQ